MVAADDSHSNSMCPPHPTTLRHGEYPEIPSFVEGRQVPVGGFEKRREWGEVIPTVSCWDPPCPMDLDRARALTPWVERKAKTPMEAYHRQLVDAGGGCDTSVGPKGCGEGI